MPATAAFTEHSVLNGRRPGVGATVDHS